ATRDRYRLAVEEIARGSDLSEDEVAHAALRLASDATGGGGGGAGDSGRREADLGYFLVDDGRDLLERTAHMRRSPLLALRRLGRQFRLAAYAGAVVLFAAALAAVLAAAWPRLRLH